MVGPTFDRTKTQDITTDAGCNAISGEQEFAAILAVAGTDSTPSSTHFRELLFANDVFMSFCVDQNRDVPPAVLPDELSSDYFAQMRVKHALCVVDRFESSARDVPLHLRTRHVASTYFRTEVDIESFAHLLAEYLPDSPEMFDFSWTS